MTVNERWDKIVDVWHNNQNMPATATQKYWEQIFVEFFGYSVFGGDIDVNRVIGGAGGVPINCVILKSDGKDLFLVEIAQATKPNNTKNLFNYLTATNNKYGIFVSDKIYVYEYDYLKPENQQSCVEIEFEKHSDKGAKFIEILSKNSYAPEKLKAFLIKYKMQAKLNNSSYGTSQQVMAQELKSRITRELVFKLLTSYFETDYSPTIVSQVLTNFEFGLKEVLFANQNYNTASMDNNASYDTINAVSSVSGNHATEYDNSYDNHMRNDTHDNGGAMYRPYKSINYTVNTRSTENFKIVSYINTQLRPLLERGVVENYTVQKMQDPEYCKAMFGNPNQLLISNKYPKDSFISSNYFPQPIYIRGVGYYLLKEWKDYMLAAVERFVDRFNYYSIEKYDAIAKNKPLPITKDKF